MILGPLGLVGRANHPAQWGRMGDEDCTKEADCMHGVRLCHLPVHHEKPTFIGLS